MIRNEIHRKLFITANGTRAKVEQELKNSDINIEEMKEKLDQKVLNSTIDFEKSNIQNDDDRYANIDNSIIERLRATKSQKFKKCKRQV